MRTLGTPHAETNAAMLPRDHGGHAGALAEAMAALANALGPSVAGTGARIEALGGGRRRLSELGADEEDIDAALDGILARAELGMTPDPPDRGRAAAVDRKRLVTAH